MDLTRHCLNIYTKPSLTIISLFFLFLLLPFTTQAANGPSVNKLSKSLTSTWNTLLKTTDCNRKPPQDSICIQAHHGKTITVRLFGKSVNALILFETITTPDVTGPVVTQQAGFLIGPINGYGYKVVNEQMAHGLIHDRRITDNGLKVYAHSVAGDNIGHQGIQLNKGQDWLDDKNGPWIYHWNALSKVNEVLKDVEHELKDKYN